MGSNDGLGWVVGPVLVVLGVSSALGAGLELVALRGPSAPEKRTWWLNLVALPLLGVLVAHLAPPHDVKDTLVLLLLCPAGSSSALVARLGGADGGRVARTYAGLVAGGPLALVAGSVLVGGGAAIPWHALSGAGMALVPLAVGAWIRARHGARAQSWVRPVRRVGSVALVSAVVLLLLTRLHLLPQVGLASALVLMGLAPLLAVVGGLLTRPEPALGAGLTLVRSLSVALPVSSWMDRSGVLSLRTAFYGLCMYAVGALMVPLLRRRAPHAH